MMRKSSSNGEKEEETGSLLGAKVQAPFPQEMEESGGVQIRYKDRLALIIRAPPEPNDSNRFCCCGCNTKSKRGWKVKWHSLLNPRDIRTITIDLPAGTWSDPLRANVHLSGKDGDGEYIAAEYKPPYISEFGYIKLYKDTRLGTPMIREYDPVWQDRIRKVWVQYTPDLSELGDPTV